MIKAIFSLNAIQQVWRESDWWHEHRPKNPNLFDTQGVDLLRACTTTRRLLRRADVAAGVAQPAQAYVHNKVRSGCYLSASEVVREALRALEERDRQRELKLAALRDSVAAGRE